MIFVYNGMYGTIKVKHTLTKDKNGKIIIGETTKTDAGERTIQLVPKAKEVLELALKKMQSNKYGVVFIDKKDKLMMHIER